MRVRVARVTRSTRRAPLPGSPAFSQTPLAARAARINYPGHPSLAPAYRLLCSGRRSRDWPTRRPRHAPGPQTPRPFCIGSNCQRTSAPASRNREPNGTIGILVYIRPLVKGLFWASGKIFLGPKCRTNPQSFDIVQAKCEQGEMEKGHGWQAAASRDLDQMNYSFGKRTVSITWITPLPQSMSALTTLALLIFTPSVASIITV